MEATIPFSRINHNRYNFILVINFIHAPDYSMASVNGGDSANIIYGGFRKWGFSYMVPFTIITLRIVHTVCALSFCCGLLTADFTHIPQGYFADTGAIRLSPSASEAIRKTHERMNYRHSEKIPYNHQQCIAKRTVNCQNGETHTFKNCMHSVCHSVEARYVKRGEYPSYNCKCSTT